MRVHIKINFYVLATFDNLYFLIGRRMLTKFVIPDKNTRCFAPRRKFHFTLRGATAIAALRYILFTFKYNSSGVAKLFLPRSDRPANLSSRRVVYAVHANFKQPRFQES